MHQQPDDIAVIQMVLQGQQAAYSTLVDRYQLYVFTLVMRYVKERELAEELSQDVFVKAYRCLADFKGNSKYSTWLYTIVHTTCLSHLRKRKDDTVLLEEEKMVSLTDSLGSEDPFSRMEQQGRKQMLDAAVKHLPPDDAHIITLHYQGDQSLEEIGIIIGATPGNVKVKLFRARQKLRALLSPAAKVVM